MSDLIDREVLKEDLRRFFPTEVLEGIEPKTLFAQIMHDIDNASTVEPEITNDDLQAAMTESYRLGYELAETEFKRPQGEYTEEDIKQTIKENFELGYEMAKNKYECPNCSTSTKGGDTYDK